MLIVSNVQFWFISEIFISCTEKKDRTSDICAVLRAIVSSPVLIKYWENTIWSCSIYFISDWINKKSIYKFHTTYRDAICSYFIVIFFATGLFPRHAHGVVWPNIIHQLTYLGLHLGEKLTATLKVVESDMRLDKNCRMRRQNLIQIVESTLKFYWKRILTWEPYKIFSINLYIKYL